MPTHILNLTWTRNSEQIPTSPTPISVTADGEVNADISVPLSSTDLHVVLPVDVSALALLVLSCDKNLQIETNAVNHAGGDILHLSANEPLIWTSTGGLTCPLTLDVTAWYLTREGGDAAVGTGTLKIRTLQDVSP